MTADIYVGLAQTRALGSKPLNSWKWK